MRRLLWFCNALPAFVAGILTAPLVLICALAIWIQDLRSPFYLPLRVGRGGKNFRLLKLRSMVVGADKCGVDTTIRDDPRVTRFGRVIRLMKIDELPQFWNVVVGDMALVGPRPNVRRETDLYTEEENRMLLVSPGITDLASIVFSDLADILAGAEDPNIAYNQLIRPWKSRFAIFYIDNRTIGMDLKIIGLTAWSFVSASGARKRVAILLRKYGAPQQLIDIALRKEGFRAIPPPGAVAIVTNREAKKKRS